MPASFEMQKASLLPKQHV